MPKTKKYMVIVESPAKAKTIGKYLGSSYFVRSSMGHVRDLPEKNYLLTSKTTLPPNIK